MDVFASVMGLILMSPLMLFVGILAMADGSVRALDRESLTAPLDAGLRRLSIAVPLLAVAALLLRL